MRKNIVISILAVTFFAVTTGLSIAQNACLPPNSSCSACDTVYAPILPACSGFTGVGANVLNDKLGKPFHYGLASAGDCGCGIQTCGHGCLGDLFGFRRNVQCARGDHYNYTPGYGANGQGLYPGVGFGFQGRSAYPSYQGYTYRSPRDFLNPNPPTIGY
ncbi:MAG: hypothetical protein LBJ67_11095 [Planctomycetaceae bacterium]|jgi:hypothetical protein|nr:hypothetical protein [Planctomycetaceae bacterium]